YLIGGKKRARRLTPPDPTARAGSFFGANFPSIARRTAVIFDPKRTKAGLLSMAVAQRKCVGLSSRLEPPFNNTPWISPLGITIRRYRVQIRWAHLSRTMTWYS